MAMIFPSDTCQRFTPGHNVHFIQWNLSTRGPWHDVTLLSRSGMAVVVHIDGHQETWRFHDEEYDRQILDHWPVGPGATLSEHNLLQVGTRYLYPCRHPKDWRDCRTFADLHLASTDPADRIATQTDELGGFFGQL